MLVGRDGEAVHDVEHRLNALAHGEDIRVTRHEDRSVLLVRVLQALCVRHVVGGHSLRHAMQRVVQVLRATDRRALNPEPSRIGEKLEPGEHVGDLLGVALEPHAVGAEGLDRVEHHRLGDHRRILRPAVPG